MEIFTGIPVSPGVAIGDVFRLETEERNIPERLISPEEADAEVARVGHAVQEALGGLARLRDASGVGSDLAAIFSTHDMVLQDETLHEDIEQIIRQRLVSAERAVAEVFDELVERFERLEEQYFAQRASDMRDIERRLLRALMGDRRDELARFEEGVVIVAHDLTPSQTALLDSGRALGFVTDVGGPTSHTAIVARSVGLPAVVGLGTITSRLADGTRIIVDGNRGQVIVDPDETQVQRYAQIAIGYARYLAELDKSRDLPSETRDGHVIRLMGNIEGPGDVSDVLEAGGYGIGLFRTEFLFKPGEPPPSEEDHFQAYLTALRQLGGRPLTIRTLDFGADKITPEAVAQPEPNPFLGSRSIRLCLERPNLFLPQLRAILRASGYGTVRLLFPMVSGLDELRRAKSLLEKAKVSLRTEGHPVRDIPIGIMVEIPSAAVIADLLVDEVDFFSIGTNDLIQYGLAVDRVNERVAHLYQPGHPAILRLIREVVRVGAANGKGVSLCGEMAGDMLYTVLLIGMGLREFSMQSRAIPEVKKVIRSVTVEQSREVAAWCAGARDYAEVMARLREQMSELLPSVF